MNAPANNTPAVASGGPRKARNPKGAPKANGKAHEPEPLLNPQLLACKSWLLHKNKKPYYTNGRPRSGTLDSPEDRGKLATYDEAVTVLNGTYTGLGIAINDGLQFFDLDACRNVDTGKVDPKLVTFINAAIELGAFIEVSRSGTGFHVLGFHPSGEAGSIPTFKGKGVEVYTHGRYMALGCEILATGSDTLPDLKPLLDLLPQVPRKAPERSQESAKPARAPLLWPDDKKTAQEGLPWLDPDMEYPEWVKVGMALHDASGGSADGLKIWDDWSSAGSKFVEGKCAYLWGGFKITPDGVKMGTLVRMANEAKKAEAAPERAFTMMDAGALLATEFDPLVYITTGSIELTAGAYILAGKPKHGKSWLAMGLAVSVCTGEKYLDTTPTEKGHAIYIACDDSSERRFQSRLLAVKPASLLAGLMGVVSRWAPTADSTIAVLDEVAGYYPKLRLVVIDTLSAFRKGQRTDSPYQQEYDELKALNDWAHSHGVIVLVVHHLRKGAVDPTDPFESISGTLGLQGAVDGMMVLSRVDDNDGGLLEQARRVLDARARHRGRTQLGAGTEGRALAPCRHGQRCLPRRHEPDDREGAARSERAVDDQQGDPRQRDVRLQGGERAEGGYTAGCQGRDRVAPGRVGGQVGRRWRLPHRAEQVTGRRGVFSCLFVCFSYGGRNGQALGGVRICFPIETDGRTRFCFMHARPPSNL